MDPARLFPTIFKGEAGVPRDDEAYEAWLKLVPADRIGELGAADNFWQMGDTGPCGRCSEIYFFRGGDLPCDAEKLGKACSGVECSCDRYIEVWNNVFMEFDRQAGRHAEPAAGPLDRHRHGPRARHGGDPGQAVELRHRSVRPDPRRHRRSRRTQVHGVGRRSRRCLDARDRGPHPRDDVPDQRRRQSRRTSGAATCCARSCAARCATARSSASPSRCSTRSSNVVVDEMGDAYPDLQANRETIIRVVRSEEERFDAVLTAGLPRIEEVLDRAEAGSRIVPGDDAFRLYDSLGVPYDFMEDLASQRGLTIDRAGLRPGDGGSARQGTRRQFLQGRREGADLRGGSAMSNGRSKRPATSSRVTTPPASRGVPVLGDVRRGGAAGRGTRDGRARLRRAREDPVLRRIGRPGIRCRTDHRRVVRCGRRADDQAGIEPAAPAPGPRRAGRSGDRRHRHRGGDGRGPRCDAAQSHRDSPAACGVAAACSADT